MNRQPITFALILTYLWVLMILSLETAEAFMVVKGPSDFFPPVGTLAMLTGLGSVILGWRVKSARYWILGSVMIMFVGEYLFSVVFFWPRNTIKFAEGTAVHSVAYLKQTAQAFQTGHWLRLVMSAAASVFSFVGFLKFYRNRITSG